MNKEIKKDVCITYQQPIRMETWNDKQNTETAQQCSCLFNGNAIKAEMKINQNLLGTFIIFPHWVLTYFTCDIPTRIFLCVSSTPFGRPVVPDEHNTNATLFCISMGLQLNSLHSSSCRYSRLKFGLHKYAADICVLEHHTHLNRTNQFRIWNGEFCRESFVHLFAAILLDKYNLFNKRIFPRNFKCTRCNSHRSKNQFWPWQIDRMIKLTYANRNRPNEIAQTKVKKNQMNTSESETYDPYR